MSNSVSTFRREVGKPARLQRGLSIIELMVAVAIGLFLLSGLIGLLVSNVINRSELDKSARQIENGRYALELLSEDLQIAGFNGAAARSAFMQVAPTSCPAAVNQLAYTPVTVPGSSSVPMSVYALSAAPTCIDHMKANTAILIISRVATTTPVTPAAAAANTTEPYLQVSSCATDTQPFAIDQGGGTFPLLKKDCATPAMLRKVVQHVYYVSTCNVCTGTGADTTPTLKMAEYVSGAMTVTPLVEGIEDLQLEYGIDYNDAGAGLTGDGSPDCYTSDPSNPPAAEISTTACPATTPAYTWTNATKNWSNVVAVRIHALARNTDSSGTWKDTRTYDMGLAKGTVGPFNDAYKRHVYSAVARLYNISGQRE